MKTNNQIKVDEWFVKPAVSLLNLLVKLLGSVLNIDHKLEGKKFKTIAVCKYKGLGSIIQATPLLKTLRTNYPNAKLIFVTTPANKSILEKTGLVDKVVTLNDSSAVKLMFEFPRFIIQLIRLKIEVYIDLEVYSNFSTLATILSMAKNRLGFYIQSKHYRLGNYTHMMYHNTQSPIMETYLQFARLCGCSINDTQLLALPKESDLINIDSKTLNLSEIKYIVLNPNASDLRLERRWGRKNYNELIHNLIQKYPDYKLAIIGGKNELSYVNKVLDTFEHENILNFAGKTNLSELIAIIQNANLMITNDSGPMHIAFSCSTPVICLFGPCSPIQYGSHTLATAIYKNVYCSPCVHDFVNPPCKGNNMCMKLIATNDVMASIDQYFDHKELKTELSGDIIYQHQNFVLGTLNRKM